MTIVFDSRCSGYHQPGHPEKPNRVARTVDLLRLQKSITLQWAGPAEVSEALLLRGHTPEHLARLKVEAAFDADTPWHPGIEEHARRSVGAAVRAMELAVAGEPAFALMRPPGHHAERDRAMGFCYYSSMALAALEAQARGSGPVAVFDFDVHHGNGTQAAFEADDSLFLASIHQMPLYPGTGAASETGVGNIVNVAVEPHAARESWRASFAGGLMPALDDFAPDLILISAGFDAHRRDPLAHQSLEAEDFAWATRAVIEVARRHCGGKVVSSLEGGYDLEGLGRSALAHVRALGEA